MAGHPPAAEGRQDLVLLNLPKEFDEYLPAAKRAPYAVLTLLVVIVLMATGIVPNVQAALIGCLMMGLFAASTSTAPTARSR
jgi:hypothetical protein